MKKIISSTILVAALAVNSMAYDATKAEEFSKFFSNFTQKACADSKLFIESEEVMKMLRDHAGFTLLDIRTNGEAAVVALSSENGVHIPLKDLFGKTNLDTLPLDKPIIIVCHSGTRATIAAIGLKQLGFKQVRVLKGGLVALADADTPKNAPMK